MILRKLKLSRSIIKEAGEGHRWKFDYENFQHDPTPDVLVLGSYNHPNTHNDLVGAINLNYLDDRDKNDLRRILPDLTRLSGLQKRSRYVRETLPFVFDNAYRQYNVNHISNLKRGVLYPVYGVLRKDDEVADAAREREKEQADLEPQRVAAQQDIRDIEQSYDRELENRASDVPADPSSRSTADQDTAAEYIKSTSMPDPSMVARDREAIERRYASDKDDTSGSVSGAYDPDIPTSATFKTSDEPTDTQAIAGEAAPEQDPKVLEAERQASRRAAEYRRLDDLEDRINSSSVDAAAVVPIRPVAPPPMMPPTKKNEIIKTDSDDVANTEHDLAGGEGRILDGVELPKTESVDRRLISYYSPRLKRYIMEEL